MLPGTRRSVRCLFGFIALTVVLLPGAAHAREATWTQMWGSQTVDFAEAIALDSANNSVVVGYTYGEIEGETSAGRDDAWIRSYDEDGTLRWGHQFGTSGYDDAGDVAIDPADNAYVVGSVNEPFPGQTMTGISDGFIRKYDPAGEEVWTRQYGFSDLFASADFVAVDGVGGVYVGGTLYTGSPNASFMPSVVRKYDAEGNVLWTHQYGIWPPGGGVNGIAFTGGTLYVAGNGPLEGPPGQYKPGGWLKAFDPDGTELWSHVASGYSINAIAANPAGRIAVTGEAYRGYAYTLYARVYDGAGQEIWTRKYDDGSDDLYNGVAIDDAGNVFVGGTKLKGEESGAAQVRRFNADGSRAWRFVIDAAPPNSVVTGLVAPENGSLYVVGAADGDFAGGRGIGWIDAYLLELNQVPTCTDTSNPSGNERGILSAPIHGSVEPALPAPLDGTAHELNCTVIDPLRL